MGEMHNFRGLNAKWVKKPYINGLKTHTSLTLLQYLAIPEKGEVSAEMTRKI